MIVRDLTSKGVPVVDEYILGKFFSGKFEDVIVRSSDFSIQKRFEIKFYSDQVDAEEMAPSYFSSPPQIKKFLDGINFGLIKIHPVSDLDWSGQYFNIECVPENFSENSLSSQ